jgi:hypothetical protein
MSSENIKFFQLNYVKISDYYLIWKNYIISHNIYLEELSNKQVQTEFDVLGLCSFNQIANEQNFNKRINFCSICDNNSNLISQGLDSTVCSNCKELIDCSYLNKNCGKTFEIIDKVNTTIITEFDGVYCKKYCSNEKDDFIVFNKTCYKSMEKYEINDSLFNQSIFKEIQGSRCDAYTDCYECTYNSCTFCYS